jgi:hypothetical protein
MKFRLRGKGRLASALAIRPVSGRVEEEARMRLESLTEFLLRTSFFASVVAAALSGGERVVFGGTPTVMFNVSMGCSTAYPNCVGGPACTSAAGGMLLKGNCRSNADASACTCGA